MLVIILLKKESDFIFEVKKRAVLLFMANFFNNFLVPIF